MLGGATRATVDLNIGQLWIRFLDLVLSLRLFILLKDCDGKRQSPIDLVFNIPKYSTEPAPLSFEGYDEVICL